MSHTTERRRSWPKGRIAAGLVVVLALIAAGLIATTVYALRLPEHLSVEPEFHLDDDELPLLDSRHIAVPDLPLNVVALVQQVVSDGGVEVGLSLRRRRLARHGRYCPLAERTLLYTDSKPTALAGGARLEAIHRLRLRLARSFCSPIPALWPASLS